MMKGMKMQFEWKRRRPNGSIGEEDNLKTNVESLIEWHHNFQVEHEGDERIWRNILIKTHFMHIIDVKCMRVACIAYI